MKTLKSLLLALCMIPAGLNAQEYMTPFNHNLLNGHHYDLIVGESSGDIAYHHILDMAPYERDRRSGEYSGLFMESSYVTDKLNEYGLEGVEVELLGKPKELYIGSFFIARRFIIDKVTIIMTRCSANNLTIHNNRFNLNNRNKFIGFTRRPNNLLNYSLLQHWNKLNCNTILRTVFCSIIQTICLLWLNYKTVKCKLTILSKICKSFVDILKICRKH